MYDVNKWRELYTPHTDYEKSQHSVVSLPEKYNVNLQEIDKGIESVLNNFEMVAYVDPQQIGKDFAEKNNFFPKKSYSSLS